MIVKRPEDLSLDHGDSDALFRQVRGCVGGNTQLRSSLTICGIVVGQPQAWRLPRQNGVDRGFNKQTMPYHCYY
jgi:hypothetical protein